MSTQQTSAARTIIARLAKRAYEHTSGPQHPVSTLALVEQLRWMLDQAERRLVEGARADGVSWGQIARALRVSRQAVWQRYGRDQEDDRNAAWPFVPATPRPRRATSRPRPT